MLNHYSFSIRTVRTFVGDVMFEHREAKTWKTVGRGSTLNFKAWIHEFFIAHIVLLSSTLFVLNSITLAHFDMRDYINPLMTSSTHILRESDGNTYFLPYHNLIQYTRKEEELREH